MDWAVLIGRAVAQLKSSIRLETALGALVGYTAVADHNFQQQCAVLLVIHYPPPLSSWVFSGPGRLQHSTVNSNKRYSTMLYSWSSLELVALNFLSLTLSLLACFLFPRHVGGSLPFPILHGFAEPSLHRSSITIFLKISEVLSRQVPGVKQVLPTRQE